MRGSIFDYIGNLDTLIAVIVGAFLATGGALLAEIIQEKRNRKRQERAAARFFGEILSSIDKVLDVAFNSHNIGERWGSATIRLYKTALRETAIYERNRERLFEIHDREIRSRIHSHFLIETMPLESIIEASEDISRLQDALDEEPDMAPHLAEKITGQIAEIVEDRERSYSFLVQEHAKTFDICADLEKLGGVKFGDSINQERLAERASEENEPVQAAETPDGTPRPDSALN